MSRLVVVLVIVLFAGQARADEVCAQQAQAQALFDDGQALFRQKDFGSACAKLQASVNLCPRFIGARGKLAECFEQVGRLASAWAAWRDVAGVADKTGNNKDRQRAEVARARAAQLEPRLARLTVIVPAAVQGGTAGLEVERDGNRVEAAALGQAIPVDAGRHRVRAVAPGRLPWQLDVLVSDGAAIEIEVEPLAVLPSIAPEKITEVRVVPDTRAAHDLALQRRRDRLITASVTAGFGGLALAAAGYFAFDARAAWNDAREDHGCSDSGACPDIAGVQRVEDAHRSARSADLLAGVGALAVVTGAVLWLTAPDEPSAIVTPVAGGAAIGVTGRF